MQCSSKAFPEEGNIKDYLQYKYAYRGDTADLQITDGRSEPDARGDEILEFIGGAYHHRRSVKLARTIADLTGSEDIQSVDLAESLHLRLSEVINGVM